MYFPKVDPFVEKLSMFEIATYDMHKNKGCMRASRRAKKIYNSFFSQTRSFKLENKSFNNKLFCYDI